MLLDPHNLTFPVGNLNSLSGGCSSEPRIGTALTRLEDPRGVTITALGNPFSDPTGTGLPQNRAFTTVLLPLRRGEAKLFSFLQLAEEYNSSASAEAAMLSVVWRENRPDPILVMTEVAAPRMF